MAFPAGFMMDATATPNWWREWALATIQRTFGHQGGHVIHAPWMVWLGTTRWTHFPAVDPSQSDFLIGTDGTNAVITFDGTRGYMQFVGNIFDSVPRRDSITGDEFHGYFLWRAAQVWPSVVNFLDSNSSINNIMVHGHSLGGSIAQIVARRLKRMSFADTVTLSTIGQPRTVSGLIHTTEAIPYVRIVIDRDPVPGTPPSASADFTNLGFGRLRGVAAFWHHTSQAWFLRDRQNPTREDLTVFDGLPSTGAAYLGGLINGPHDGVGPRHFANAYSPMLKWLYQSNPAGAPDLTTIYQMETILDVWDRDGVGVLPLEWGPTPPAPPRATQQPLIGHPFADIEVEYDGARDFPPIPDSHVGMKVEQRVVGHSLFFFGGRNLMAKTFQKRDRQLLITAKKVLTNMQARDVRVADPKPTTKLSNRILFFPPGGTPDVKNEVTHVLAKIDELLGLST